MKDNEVWLKIFCARLSQEHASMYTSVHIADEGLKEYKKRFSENKKEEQEK